jgi:DNA-binding CsgD family transcriptional regulator
MNRKFTDREMQVLRGISNGESNGDIGRRLYLTVSTVKGHVRLLFAKLDARDRAHAVALAFKQGLLPVVVPPALPVPAVPHRIGCPSAKPSPCTCRPLRGRTT